MATATHGQTGKSTRSKTTRRRAPAQTDAIALLKADHRAVEKLFADFEKARGDERKLRLARQICAELKVHTQIEEEILYPASRDFLDDDEIVNEAIVEHQAAKDLVAEIEAMTPADDLFDAKVTVLQEQIEHHVGEEEKDYFPQLQKSDMDLKTVGERLQARKDELKAAMDHPGQAMQ